MQDERHSAVGAFASSALVTARLLWARRLRLPRHTVGRHIFFADGSASRVYRETTRLEPICHPAALVVAFRLRLVGRMRLLQAVFRAESILNTPLFAGFPGFRTKLWLTDERTGVYRGVYDWEGAGEARHCATTLARLLRLVCVPGTVVAHVEDGMRRDELLEGVGPVEAPTSGSTDRWWVGHVAAASRGWIAT
jgi:hypothetical protein